MRFKRRLRGLTGPTFNVYNNTMQSAKSRWFGSTLLLVVSLSSAGRADDTYYPPPDVQGGWRTVATAAEARDAAGIDLDRLDPAFEVVRHATANSGLLVVRHGYLVFEKYAGKAHRDSNPDMASTGKAVTSMACGIMLDEFHDRFPEGLNTHVFTPAFLPEAFPLDDPRKAQITLGQLLCMTAGYNGEGGSPSGMIMGKFVPLKPAGGQNIHDLDQSSLKTPLWTDPGAGYSYSSPSPHVASLVLRHVTGMELQDFIDAKLGKPMGWGPWAYCLHRGEFTMPHANGAGSIALHATDALRFAYLLAHHGKWKDQQLVPAAYVALCSQVSPFNPHCPFTLQFEQNSDGHVLAAPRDAMWKSGAGGFCIYAVPSLDLAIYKMGGNDGQYDPTLTGLPQPTDDASAARKWEPVARTPFNDGSLMGDDGLRRVLELVCAACRE